jgi:hypothetical protein
MIAKGLPPRFLSKSFLLPIALRKEKEVTFRCVPC